ncbi:MAG: multicopper oxidase domain-containing protein [Dehalococcoidia bacterium]
MKLAAVFGAIFGFSALLISVVALSQAGSGSAATSPAASHADPTAVVAESRIAVELGDIFIRPQQLTAPTGSSVVLDVANTGAIQHDLKLDNGAGTPMLNPGDGAALDLGPLDAGTYVLYCTVPGHREGGMTAELIVSDDAAHGDGHGAGGRMLHNDDDYMAGVEAFPAATEGLGGQPMAPVMDGDVKVFELTATEMQWEVEPGVWRDAMAYNGQVPGPQIRVQLGDTVRVVFHNELPESSAIHFHGLVLPYTEDGVPGLTQPLVLPGESWTYEFEVRNTGSHMYHSHMNGSVQIPMGLLGAFIVEDDTGGPVDQDITMILNDGPLGYTINGKGFPATQPIVANLGERIRIRYMNEGLQIHPMHLHGMPQLVVAKDGYPLPTPHYEDTVTVAPGERWDVIVDVTEPGIWAFHCHILTHAEGPNGMFGMVTVLIANE